jgi:hypothetical protein
MGEEAAFIGPPLLFANGNLLLPHQSVREALDTAGIFLNAIPATAQKSAIVY